MCDDVILFLHLQYFVGSFNRFFMSFVGLKIHELHCKIVNMNPHQRGKAPEGMQCDKSFKVLLILLHAFGYWKTKSYKKKKPLL